MSAAGRSDPRRAKRGKGGGRCPICGQPRSEDYRPFCSKRCADVDLGRWLSGSYAVSGTPDAEEDGGEGAAETGEAKAKPPGAEEG